MSRNDISYNKKQLIYRPSVREIAKHFLNEELQNELESFLQYMKMNKMTLSLCRCNTFQSRFKGNTLFRIEIANGQACVNNIYAVKICTADETMHFREEKRELIQNNIKNYSAQFDDETANVFMSHLSRCSGCGKCKPGIKLEINNKIQSALCACNIYALRFENPSEADYDTIKKFIYARKQYITDLRA